MFVQMYLGSLWKIGNFELLSFQKVFFLHKSWFSCCNSKTFNLSVYLFFAHREGIRFEKLGRSSYRCSYYSTKSTRVLMLGCSKPRWRILIVLKDDIVELHLIFFAVRKWHICMYGKIVIKILIPDGVYIGISLKHVDVWEPALLEYCLIQCCSMLDGPYKVDGARQGSHNPRVSLEGYFIFEIGGICCCWWCWFEDGVNKRVACACAQNQTAKGSCNFGTTTPVCVGKLTWNGVLYSKHSANDLFS